MHYYQHHIGDFIKATARLSDSQLVGYLRLLWMYYDQERPLHNDLDVLSMQIGMPIDDTFLLLRAYFKKDGDVWRHTRCDKEIAEYHDLIAKKSNAGKASAERKKKNSSAGVQQVFDSSQTDEQLTSNHEPITINQDYSVAKATGDKSPLTPDEIIFGYGLPLLTNAGTADKQARSFLGGLRKSHGDDAVIDALRDCIRAKPLQPLEWLAKVLPPGGRQKLNKQEALEASNRAVVERLLRKEGLA